MVFPANCSVSSLTTSGNLLFAGVWGTGVFVSTDNGSNWIQKSSGLTIPYILCFAVSGTDIYAGTQGGVFLSTNIGHEWIQVNNGLTTTYILSFAVSGSNIMAGTFGGGVFITQDKGANWNAFNDGLIYSNIFSMTVSDEYAFAGTALNGGVWRRSLSDITSTEEHTTVLPSRFNLSQNYPNPFNPSTTFRYSIPNESKVIIKVYDILGKEITTLLNEEKSAGSYEVDFNAVNLPSGVYFYQLKVGEYTNTKTMILIK